MKSRDGHPVQSETGNRRKTEERPAYFPVEPGKTGALQREPPGKFRLNHEKPEAEKTKLFHRNCLGNALLNRGKPFFSTGTGREIPGWTGTNGNRKKSDGLLRQKIGSSFPVQSQFRLMCSGFFRLYRKIFLTVRLIFSGKFVKKGVTYSSESTVLISCPTPDSELRWIIALNRSLFFNCFSNFSTSFVWISLFSVIWQSRRFEPTGRLEKNGPQQTKYALYLKLFLNYVFFRHRDYSS